MSARDIIAVCQSLLPKYSKDCSGFVKAVAEMCGVILVGNANAIVSTLYAGQQLADGPTAREAALRGQLVIGGAPSSGSGHVVVVVAGPLSASGKHPYAFWGQLHMLNIGGNSMNVGFTRGHGTVNYAFKGQALNLVKYAAFSPISSLLPRAPTGGLFPSDGPWHRALTICHQSQDRDRRWA